MKLVVQRVSTAQVEIDNKIYSKIGKGLLVLLGVHKNDNSEKIPWLVDKLLGLRIFEDPQGKMNLGLDEVKGELLIVSQFTLYANCTRGRRPDFLESARPEMAEKLYEEFVCKLKNKTSYVQTGQFGADMKISLVNEGPVTLIIEN